VLEQTPGISVQNLGSERFNVYSRGYSVDNYQYDGIPTSLDVVSQISSQSLADMAIYDRVEVLRGPVGLMTGAGDPSATVNLVRKKPTAQFQGYASVGIGSWNMQRTEVDLSGPLNQAGTLRGRVVGAFQKNDSYVDYYHQEKQVFYGVLEADLTDSTLLTAGLIIRRISRWADRLPVSHCFTAMAVRRSLRARRIPPATGHSMSRMYSMPLSR